VIFFKFFELSIECFERVARDRSKTPRLMHLSACRVGGRDHDFEPCYHLPNQSLMACKLHVVQFNLPCSFCCIRSRR